VCDADIWRGVAMHVNLKVNVSRCETSLVSRIDYSEGGADKGDMPATSGTS